MIRETRGRLRASTALLLSAALLVGGCSAKWNTAFRQNAIPPDRPGAITVDAKQRHVLMQPEYLQGSDERRAGDIYVKLRMCAEPAPDVFAAIAASGSALISVDAKTQTGSGQLGIAAAETAASIERTQTINLLRESFFRTCERYLSGAITRESFIVQAGRDSRAMVAVLAIEQLTGAIRRPSTIISGPGTSASARAASALADALLAAQERARKARADMDANAILAGKNCSNEAADKKAACDTEKADAEKKKPALETASKRADDEVKQLLQMAEAVGAGGASASTQPGTTNPGGSDQMPSDLVIKEVTLTVQRIVEQTFAQDEFRLLCLQQLAGGSLQQACQKLLEQGIEGEAQALAVQYATTQKLLVEHTDERFALYRTRVSVDGSFDRTKNASVVNAYLRSGVPLASFVRLRLAELAAAQDENSARIAFGKLPNQVREDIAQGDR